MTGQQIYIKCENLQRTGSFKIRGAYLRISKLTEQERAHGVVAASAGNHAQGVALAAQLLGIKATVFMPLRRAHPEGEGDPRLRRVRRVRRYDDRRVPGRRARSSRQRPAPS